MAFSVPGYQVDQLIGYGSHAEVWSGRVAGTAERVALKRIIVPAHGDPDRAAELIRSARAEAALLTVLEHPSLIRLRQYVQTPAAVVLVMELAEGGSLAHLLRRRDRLSPAEVAAALSPIAAALTSAHSEGVLHGDISAANILFSAAGQPKLADLGVARMLIGHAGADRALGTPAYLDPVVAAGGVPGAASDVFALAAVALHCLTGSGPWHSGDPTDLQAVLGRAATGVIDDLPGKLAGCPAAMAAVVSRALDQEPCRRGSAAEFALDLGASVPSGPVVLTAGRLAVRTTDIGNVGRHSAERRDLAAVDVVPADLTHVARLQVRAEPDQPAPRRRPLRRLVTGTAGRQPAVLVAGLIIAAGIAVLALAAVRSHGWLGLAAAGPGAAQPRSAQASTPGQTPTPGQPAAPGQTPTPGQPTPSASEHAVPSRDNRSGGAVTGRSESGQAAYDRVADGQAAAKDAAADPDALLRTLADRRAEAFARNRPELLTGVYASSALLAEDSSQLRSRVPVGCGLAGLRTSYQDVVVTGSGPQRLELQATASQPQATLICAGAVRSHTQPAAATRLALRLVRVGAEYRIASQRLGGQ